MGIVHTWALYLFVTCIPYIHIFPFREEFIFILSLVFPLLHGNIEQIKCRFLIDNVSLFVAHSKNKILLVWHYCSINIIWIHLSLLFIIRFRCCCYCTKELVLFIKMKQYIKFNGFCSLSKAMQCSIFSI